MSSQDTKIKRTLLKSGLELLAKEYEKNLSYGHTHVHDNMVPWALRALGTIKRVLHELCCFDKAMLCEWLHVCKGYKPIKI